MLAREMTESHGIDAAVAKALGFPRPQYTAVERERRWLCRAVPHSLIRKTFDVKDLYVSGTRLRLREMRPIEGGAGLLRLSRKADVDPHTRLITSIYLPEEEHALLDSILPGDRLHKIRHRLHAPTGVLMSVDEFQGHLAGLLLLEAEFDHDQALGAFSAPDFADREVTSDVRYTGASLARNGLPNV